jgi:hypothetical protein
MVPETGGKGTGEVVQFHRRAGLAGELGADIPEPEGADRVHLTNPTGVQDQVVNPGVVGEPLPQDVNGAAIEQGREGVPGGGGKCGRHAGKPHPRLSHHVEPTVPILSPVRGAGNQQVIVVPLPSSLVAVTLPPCPSTRCLTMASPRPVPPASRDRAGSTR